MGLRSVPGGAYTFMWDQSDLLSLSLMLFCHIQTRQSSAPEIVLCLPNIPYLYDFKYVEILVGITAMDVMDAMVTIMIRAAKEEIKAIDTIVRKLVIEAIETILLMNTMVTMTIMEAMVAMDMIEMIDAIAAMNAIAELVVIKAFTINGSNGGTVNNGRQ